MPEHEVLGNATADTAASGPVAIAQMADAQASANGSTLAPQTSQVDASASRPPLAGGAEVTIIGVPSAADEAGGAVIAQISSSSQHGSQSEAHRRVRQHEEEILMMHFRRWILLFSLIVCLATPVMISLLIWLVVAYWQHSDDDCVMPLRTWVHVVCVIVAYNSTVNRPTPRGSCVQRYICRWTRDASDPQPPLRVRLYNLTMTIFVFMWNCVGLHWVSIDSASGNAASCREAAPALFSAVKVYASFNLAVTLFMYLNMFGFAQILRIALRQGLLRTSQAAPQGSLEKNTEVATMDDPLLQENPSCSICLDEFDSETPFVKTKTCSHLFHKQCLKGWLQVNRTCPLCREDLGSTPSGAPAMPPV
uniref:RING-type domain-containing protein n=1 Tax=Zooxanthella nutricula TaxID=1333877 RepID=A0A6U8UNG5_9DINO|mmetsp:Transcript_75489/g.230889  ORF Transcript_75489/g.230889 Transcript_75489/m.230889 type:complete len:364 (+) Transcript_75489:124-1215(+)